MPASFANCLSFGIYIGLLFLGMAVSHSYMIEEPVTRFHLPVQFYACISDILIGIFNIKRILNIFGFQAVLDLIVEYIKAPGLTADILFEAGLIMYAMLRLQVPFSHNVFSITIKLGEGGKHK